MAFRDTLATKVAGASSSIKNLIVGEKSTFKTTEDVLRAEYEVIWGGQLPEAGFEAAYRKNVQEKGQAALCLSGGGIRSAAFSLGVLQVGISLGTAMTISGAAASPSMGYNSSPATAFLMTLFNVRLGAWLANPAAKIPKEDVKAGPTSALKPLLTEALGLTDAKSVNVYLSDGGHFDNLGIYEMIRRRCRHILVVDADADEKFTFEDLARSVRFAAIDLDAKIEFESFKMKSALEATATSDTFAIGKITYAESPNDTSWLIYIKPTYFYENAPLDVRSYGTVNIAFPHETTLDQWFGESQFESYRRLGEYLMCKLYKEQLSKKIMPELAAGTMRELTLAQFFTAVRSPAPCAS